MHFYEHAGATPAREIQANLVISATFTAEPLEEALEFLVRELFPAMKITFSPFNQVFQELLRHDGALVSNTLGIGVVLFRLEDWLRHGSLHPGRIAEEFTAAVRHAASMCRVPLLVVHCPSSPMFLEQHRHSGMTGEAEGHLDLLSQNDLRVHVIKSSEVLSHFSPDYYDGYADRLGSIPYTIECFRVLASIIARRVHAILAQPYKVIVTDCDNTLWAGVLAEDGPEGISVNPPHAGVQRMLLSQHDAGVLLCLCSKNDDEDVINVFDSHPDMILRREHVAARRVNWAPKCENLSDLADELGLTLDSFVFLDDDPVECAHVRAQHPEVLVLQLPRETEQWNVFVSKVWAFDHVRVTQEAAKRTGLYVAERERKRYMRQRSSLREFLDGLNIEIDLHRVTPGEFPRVCELSQRTTQFNTSGRRLTEANLTQLSALGPAECVVAYLKDRFGGYGLVGVAYYSFNDSSLDVDTFLLSCRALGKGVEYHMLRDLGATAQARGLTFVDLQFTPTKRNHVARRFLDEVSVGIRPHDRGGHLCFSLSAATAAAIKDTIGTQPPQTAEEADVEAAPANSLVQAAARSEILSRIAAGPHDPGRLLAVSRPLPEHTNSSTVAAEHESGLVEDLCRIWQDVLGHPHIDPYDALADFGATSLHFTYVAGRIADLCSTDVPLARLMDCATVEEVARAVESLRGAIERRHSPLRSSGEKTAPIASAQWPYWFRATRTPRSRIEYKRIDLCLEGELDADAMRRAAHRLLDRHQALRTVFKAAEGGVVQCVDDSSQHFVFTTLSEAKLPPSCSWHSAAAYVDTADQEVFLNVTTGPVAHFLLLPLDTSRALLRLLVHHIACDGWSYGIYTRDLGELYRSAIEQRAPILPELPVQYVDYAAWEADSRNGPEFQDHLVYWQTIASQSPKRLYLGRARNPEKPVTLIKMPSLSGVEYKALGATAREQNCTLVTLLLGVLNCQLQRWAGQEDFLVGVVHANRHVSELFDLIGLFADIVPVRAELRGVTTFCQVLDNAKTAFLTSLAHSQVRLHEILRMPQAKNGNGIRNTLQVVFNVQEAVPERFVTPSLKAEYLDDRNSASDKDLDNDLYISGYARADSLEVQFRGNSAVFDQELLNRFALQYLALLRQIAAGSVSGSANLDDVWAKTAGRLASAGSVSD